MVVVVGFGDVIHLRATPACICPQVFPNFMIQRLTRILAHLRSFQFPLRQLSTMSTLSDQSISTAGCVIIGDEVLSSKTMDTNSAHFGTLFTSMIDDSKVLF
jgi:hypothetical protein